MQGLKSILLKEFWELKKSIKDFLLVIVSISVLVGVLAFKNTTSLFSKDLLMIFYPLFISFVVSMQFLVNSILNEKHQKTLEVLLGLDINKASIILGKVIPVTLISYFSGIIALFGMELLKIFSPHLRDYQILSIFMFVAPFFLAYLGSNLCILTSLVFPHEKSANLVFVLLSFCVFSPLYLLYRWIGLTWFSVLSLFLVLDIVVTVLNIYVFNKKINLILKM